MTQTVIGEKPQTVKQRVDTANEKMAVDTLTQEIFANYVWKAEDVIEKLPGKTSKSLQILDEKQVRM